MATSLMNDSAYVLDATKNLLQMGTALFATGDLEMKEVERSILLDNEEIMDLVED